MRLTFEFHGESATAVCQIDSVEKYAGTVIDRQGEAAGGVVVTVPVPGFAETLEQPTMHNKPATNIDAPFFIIIVQLHLLRWNAASRVTIIGAGDTILRRPRVLACGYFPCGQLACVSVTSFFQYDGRPRYGFGITSSVMKMAPTLRCTESLRASLNCSSEVS